LQKSKGLTPATAELMCVVTQYFTSAFVGSRMTYCESSGMSNPTVLSSFTSSEMAVD